MREKHITTITVIGVLLIVLLEFFKGQLVHSLSMSEEIVVRIEIGAIFLLLLIVINLVFHFTAAQTEETVFNIKAILDNIPFTSGGVVVLNSSQLYLHLIHSTRAAKHRVYNTYFGHIPPEQSNLPAKGDYFEAMTKIAKTKSSLEFRRIVLLTEANKEWIREMVNEFENHKNISIRVYQSPDNRIRPLSIQLYDDQEAYLIHLVDRPPGQPRDIVIKESVAVSILNQYYEDFWNASNPVLDCGKKVSTGAGI